MKTKKYNIVFIIISLCLLIFCIFHYLTNKYVYNIDNIGELYYGRVGHSSILLDDNKILFVGGSDGICNNYLHNAEIYNIKTKTSELIPMNTDHILPNLYKNSDDNVIIIDNNSIELYDHQKNKFILIKKNPFNLDNLINDTQMIQISDDIILITGGKTNQKEFFQQGKKEQAITNTAYLYDIKSNKILKHLKLNVPRSNHEMISYNNEIYIFGGQSNNIENSLLIEKYNPKTNHFTIIGKIKKPRTDFNIFRFKEYVFLVGGYVNNNIEIYNLKNNSSEIKKNFLINENIFLSNLNFYILNINNENILFAYKNRNKYLSGIYIYNLNSEKVYKALQLDIGRYSNLIYLDHDLLISGGEKQSFFPTRRFKICAKGKLCSFGKASKKIKLVKER